MPGYEERNEKRLTVAERYARWLVDQLRVRNWDVKTLAQQSGIPKQTLSAIVNGRAPQPTVAQVAGLARGLGVEPNEILDALGLWEAGAPPYIPSELLESYRDLGYPGRRALLGMSRLVKEMQSEYESWRRERASTGDIAAALEPVRDVINEAVDEDEPRAAEQRSSYVTGPLHQPGTMPEIEPVAADDDSDVKRAQRQREARREQKRRDESHDGD